MRPGLVVPWLSAAAYFALEWVANGFFGYGFYNDELYYLSCARRPALGYVDHPPLSIWLLSAVRSLGESLPVLRLGPALCGALAMFLAVRVCLRLGGSTRAA